MPTPAFRAVATFPLLPLKIMNQKTVALACLLKTLLASVLTLAAEDSPPTLKLTGDWQVQVTQQLTGDWQVQVTQQEQTAMLDVAPPIITTVKAEKYDRLPIFNSQAGVWARGVALCGTVAQECANFGLVDPASLMVRTGPEADAPQLKLGKEFVADLDWATIGRLADGPLGENQPVYVDYRYAALRIDSVVMTRQGQVALRQGTPHVATPVPPALAEGDRRLANVFVPGRIAKLEPQHLFPILETVYPEPPKPSPSPAEQFLPKTLKKLRDGSPLRILAWGDSVTDGSYVPQPEQNRWQAQFVARLQSQFPTGKIELMTEAWGGHSTTNYLAEPAGGPHNYQEKVLAAKPDLIVSEFVNDASLTPEQVEERYGKFLADFTAIGVEWIILTPHYVRPDWMGLSAQRDIDADPRPYVAGLRQFAAQHDVALADASLRWGRLWRQGIPYATLHMNAINHPNPAGMKLFADSIMMLFP